MTQDEFWVAIDTKLEHARFFYNGMFEALEPVQRTQSNVALRAGGAIMATGWQLRLFANLDAFVAMARRVPDIGQASFGSDAFAADMRAWLKTLSNDEQERRRDFTDQFKPTYSAFRDLPFSKARIAASHRTGDTGTTVQVTTWFGVSYDGSAIEHIPDVVTRPIPPGRQELTWRLRRLWRSPSQLQSSPGGLTSLSRGSRYMTRSAPTCVTRPSWLMWRAHSLARFTGPSR